MLFIFLNTLSIFKVMRQNRNLLKFDMLTLSSSNMTDQNLFNERAFEQINTQCFYLHFANSNCKVNFSHFILNIKKKLFHIWNLHKIHLLNCQKSSQKSFFLKSLTYYETNLTLKCFFTRSTPPKKFNQQMASSRAKTRSTKSQGYYYFY